MATQLKHVAAPVAVMLAVLLVAGCSSTPHRRLTHAVNMRQQAADAYAKGDYERALTDYRGLADAMPGDTGTWFRLGNIYAHLNRPQQAVAAYRHVLQRDPAYAKAWHNLAVMYLRQAESAFMESASKAKANAGLRQQSMGMASGIHALIQEPGGDHQEAPDSTGSASGAASQSASTMGQPSRQLVTPAAAATNHSAQRMQP